MDVVAIDARSFLHGKAMKSSVDRLGSTRPLRRLPRFQRMRVRRQPTSSVGGAQPPAAQIPVLPREVGGRVSVLTSTA